MVLLFAVCHLNLFSLWLLFAIRNMLFAVGNSTVECGAGSHDFNVFPKDFSLGSLLRVYIRGCNVFVYRKSKNFGQKFLLLDKTQNVAKFGKK